jgi:transposase
MKRLIPQVTPAGRHHTRDPGRVKSQETKSIRHDKEAYRGRNVIERCYCRLGDFRRVATCYDKLARNFFSGVCLVAAVTYWM